jgi:hypothetical protein
MPFDDLVIASTRVGDRTPAKHWRSLRWRRHKSRNQPAKRLDSCVNSEYQGLTPATITIAILHPLRRFSGNWTKKGSFDREVMLPGGSSGCSLELCSTLGFCPARGPVVWRLRYEPRMRGGELKFVVGVQATEGHSASNARFMFARAILSGTHGQCSDHGLQYGN